MGLSLGDYGKSNNVRQIALERIGILFSQAKTIGSSNPELAKRYVELAKKVAMSAKIHIPVQYRRQACKNCNTLFIQGVNCRVRIKQKREPHVVVTCLNCGNQTRILLKEKQEYKELEQDNNPNETPC